MGVFRVHLGPLDGVDHHIGGIRRAMRPLRGGAEPVIVIGGHQHELAPPVPGDLHRLALRLVLEFAELALEFEGTDCRHGGHPFKSNA